MKAFRIVLVLFLVSLGFTELKAQEKPLVQFSGVIYNTDSVPRLVQYVTITNKTNGNRKFTSNYQGYFSIVVHEGDTVIFSSVGYRREALIIPNNLLDKKYTVIVRMKAEVINLPIVTILPWATVDEFTRDFMTMKFADDDMETARKNISRDKIIALSRTLARDAGENQSINYKNNFIDLSNKNINMRGANPLLNPFAWGALLNQILDGDKSRSGN